MISAMDAGLEVTLQKLRELEIMDDTIVVFTSDVRQNSVPPQKSPARFPSLPQNGPTHGSSFPFRGKKRGIWEGGHRVKYMCN